MPDSDPEPETDAEADSEAVGEGDSGAGAEADSGAAEEGEEAVAEAREEVVEAMARAAEVYGLKPSYGRLYGILYFADEPLSLDDLVDRSGYAKSTVSTATTVMERYHLVHRRSIPGEGKKAYFDAERDFWHVFQQFLGQQVRSEIRIMTRALDDAAEQLREADAEQAEADLRKVERLRDVYAKAETAVNVLTSSSVDRVMGVFQRLRSGET